MWKMKKFNITVNGSTYQVEVEEVNDAVAAQPLAVKPVVSIPASAAIATTFVPDAAPIAVAAGDTPVTAPMPGKITKVVVQAGQQVSQGDVIMILEAMKMQNEITAPTAGVIKSMHSTVGQSVKVGEVMAVIG
jgi:glutaconyl-CoA decarboxylase